MTDFKRPISVVRIPGTLDQFDNLMREMWDDLDIEGDYIRYILLGLKPSTKKQVTPDGITWRIRFKLDPIYQQTHHHLVFHLATPNRAAAIQVVPESDNLCLVRFINAFDPISNEEKSELPRFGELAKRFTHFLCRKKRGHIVEQSVMWNSAQTKGDALRVVDGELKVKKSKRGPRRYSRAEKIAARQEWDSLDRDINPVTLPEWLENRFGYSPGGILNVPESTFYGWPKS